jgi:heme exporter protein A
MDKKEIIIEGASLAKSFGGRMIFRGIDISAAAGSPAAITGPNGSGKSTLLEILAGLRRPTEGTVRRPDTIGFMSPRLRLYEELTALELLDFAAKSGEAAARSGPLLERFGLHEHRHRRIGLYSTGMVQRLKFIAAVINEAPVLLLDEPCSNLDGAGRAMIFSYLDSVKDFRAIVIATNDPEEADYCTRRVDLG